MFKRDDLIGKSTQEIQEMLEKDVQTYAVGLEVIETKEEILDLEKELMVKMDENEAYLKTLTYTLPEEAKFDGTVFSRKALAEYIVDFINTQELEFSYSLGMFELVKLWKTKDLREVGYYAFDSTLRILGQCKYRGYEAWRKILAVNEFMKSCHEDYVRDTSYMVYLSSLHNSLVDVLKKFDEPAEENTDVQACEEWANREE